jgi:hypothetical protein
VITYLRCKDERKLNEEMVEAFHHTVYQLLFAANEARCDIQIPNGGILLHYSGEGSKQR